MENSHTAHWESEMPYFVIIFCVLGLRSSVTLNNMSVKLRQRANLNRIIYLLLMRPRANEKGIFTGEKEEERGLGVDLYVASH